MPAPFPTSLDSFPTITATTPENDSATGGHHTWHNEAFAALAALEAKVGIDGSPDVNSIDYKLAHMSGGGGGSGGPSIFNFFC